MRTNLPIEDVLQDLSAALEDNASVVLKAPPAAGKTTVVPVRMLLAPWLEHRKILVMEPRRLAARTAAQRMASLLSEDVGETVGYRIRQGTKVSANTRIEVITEGVLTRMLQEDPALSGVGLVIFDEFHERHLHSDVGLAMLQYARNLFRDKKDPLRVLVMSATLDGVRIAELLDAPVIEVSAEKHPVEVFYGEPQKPGASITGRVVKTINDVLYDPRSGSVLVFLPGEREIREVGEALPEIEGVTVRPLAGTQALYDQEQAIQPAPLGDRKVVLATNVAESSLTIDGVSVVIDSGLERAPEYDPVTGMTRLYTRRISQSSAVQRAGRAGRLGPGRCYRLWSEDQQKQLSKQAPAEILQADLSQTALQFIAWGVDNVYELDWLDPPPSGAWAQALELLQGMGAVSRNTAGNWTATEAGQQMARLPAHPRIAHMLLKACSWGLREDAFVLAAILAERDPLRDLGADIERRVAIVQDNEFCPQHARGWRTRVQRQVPLFQIMCRSIPNDKSVPASIGALLATAYPDRIARRRENNVYLLANGRAATLEEGDPLNNCEWLAVAEVGGQVGKPRDRIWLAAPLNPRLFMDLLADWVETAERVEWDDQADRFVAERQRRIGALVMAREPLDEVPTRARHKALLELLSSRGLGLLPWTDELRQWQSRVNLLHRELGEPWPDVSDSALMERLEDWLLPYLGSVNKLADFARLDLRSILAALLPWPLPKQLNELAPERIEVPSGSCLPIDYGQDPPVLSVKLQEMFGYELTPTIARGQVSLMIHLLSPARRPVQVTQDLASFWRNGYPEVRKELAGRYPKHPWPEDPLDAEATARTKGNVSQN
jgi:ATP-dependent helicase HrpB